jgi:hypothetical protein
MKRACIAIVDAAHARIYTYDETPAGNGARTPPIGALHEAIDLVDPGRRGHELFSTTKPGRFARRIVDEIDRIARKDAYERVVLVASPAMLGELRSVDAALERSERAVEYLARDLARLSSPQIHDHLAQLRLVAPRRVA